MSDARAGQFAVAAAMGLVLVLTGPLVGVADLTPDDPTTVGGGDATVESVRLDADALRVSDGRFGTAVSYLRIPDPSVTVTDVSGRPRLVYRVIVPTLDVERTATTVVGGPGTYRVEMADRAFDPADLEPGRYTARLQVRVQSFDVDRTVLARNVTVEVSP